jgi:hypothetical protein
MQAVQGGEGGILLDTIALHVKNLQLIDVLIIIMIGIASKGMLGEFNVTVHSGNCKGGCGWNWKSFFFKGCCLQ